MKKKKGEDLIKQQLLGVASIIIGLLGIFIPEDGTGGLVFLILGFLVLACDEKIL